MLISFFAPPFIRHCLLEVQSPSIGQESAFKPDIPTEVTAEAVSGVNRLIDAPQLSSDLSFVMGIPPSHSAEKRRLLSVNQHIQELLWSH